jgi:hypothetical protein
MRIRLFYVQNTLSQREEQKLREHRRKPMDGQVTIRYSRKKKVEDREFASIEDVQEWVTSQCVPLLGVPGVFQSYVTLFGACEAKEGAKMGALEDVFVAEEVLLPLE